MQGLVDFLLVLLSLDLEKFVLLELSVDFSDFSFLFYLLSVERLVLNNDVLVLPSTPYFILDLFLLPRGLLDSADDDTFTSGDLDHLVSLLLLDYHLATTFLTLMTTSLGLGCTKTSFVAAVLAGTMLLLSSVKILATFPH